MSDSRDSEISRSFLELVHVMHRLRQECPWDREQTPQSLLPYLIEEAYEVIEAVESGDTTEVRAELGDLLLQVLFHSELATETGDFDVADVADGIRDKLVRRHPHVFGDGDATDKEGVLKRWSEIKAEERRDAGTDDSALAGVPRALPALTRGHRVGEKAASAGFDWREMAAVLAKVDEERGELGKAIAEEGPERVEEEFGDLLFALTSLGRHLKIDSEAALRGAVARFEERFRLLEAVARREGVPLGDLSDADLEARWQRAKLTLHGAAVS